MADDLRFDGRVAIITGAGGGLGRSHALLLASRGARVVVNDLGGSMHGGGRSSAAADKVVAEIKEAGGEAVANYDSVEDGAKIVQCALDTWGRIDIVVNNAGILRDTSFHKMTDEDWDLIYRVHVLGGYRVTHAAWSHMRDAGYGRVVFTASAAGIYGNFGQANYSMAKLGLLGLSNTLAIEGHKKNVLVNTVAPIAGSRLTETVLPKDLIDALKPEYVSPLVAFLCSERCQETGGLYEVGGGFFGKLRWQRAAGKTFKLGRPITVEAVERAWPEIAGFDKATHPKDVTESMQPILANLGSRSRGGNEHIDVDEALAADIPAMESSYDERDLALYALGVGAAQDPLGKELAFVYERAGAGFQALPTFAVVPALKTMFDMALKGQQVPGLKYGFDRVLHGEQYTEVKRPLPPKARLRHKLKIKDIWDKGKGAVVITAVTTTDESGEELAYNEISTFVRGAGGWGGERGPSTPENVPPSRAPDAVVTEKTSENQALLYRLSGDWNPLHADPGFAKAFGFERPILHGLCSFGFAARAVINAFLDGDARKFKSIKVRFAESVFPGETLVTEMWKESPTRIVFQTKVKERDKVVISNAAVELYTEVPQPRPKAQPAAAAAPAQGGSAGGAPSGMPTSADIFTAVGLFLARNPELAKKVQTVFQWKLTAPESTWVLDAKNGAGSCKPGVDAKPDVTLELSDADFLAMCTGQADAQKLYFGGKLKISGNVMASQKLEFLKKIDPTLVLEAMKQRGGGAPAAAASSSPAAAPGEVTSAMVFAGIGAYLAETPELAKKVQTVFQWKLTGPDSAWVLDVKNGSGSCKPGVDAKPDVTLELADADFLALVAGKADAQKLYFGGKLKISGNVMAAQKLEFLKKIDPEKVRAIAAKVTPAAAAPAAAASAPAPARAPAAGSLFRALAERLESNPALASEVGQIVQFNVREPDQRFVVDLTGAGAVREGSDAKAAAIFTLADADLAALAKGEANARDLYQKGKLRVDGDVRLAHKLSFLNRLA